jgi:hypothetical protein
MTFKFSLPRLTRLCRVERTKRVLASADFAWRWLVLLLKQSADASYKQPVGSPTTYLNDEVPFELGESINLIRHSNLPRSFTTWWKPTFIRSFHSSVSLSFREGTPPMQNALYSPFCFHVWTHKTLILAWATTPIHLGRCAERKAGVWTRCELKWPSFGCLKPWTSRIGGVPFHFMNLTWPLYYLF